MDKIKAIEAIKEFMGAVDITEYFNEVLKLAIEVLQQPNSSELTITDPTDQVQILKNALELAEQENETLKEKTRRMKFMIDNGLGWEDIINHTRLYGRDTN